jgi:hypothetical protein
MPLRLPKLCGAATGNIEKPHQFFSFFVSTSCAPVTTKWDSRYHHEKYGWCVAARQFLIVGRYFQRQKTRPYERGTD